VGLEEGEFFFAVFISGELDPEVLVGFMWLEDADRDCVIGVSGEHDRPGGDCRRGDFCCTTRIQFPIEIKPYAFGWVQLPSTGFEEVMSEGQIVLCQSNGVVCRVLGQCAHHEISVINECIESELERVTVVLMCDAPGIGTSVVS